MTKKFDITDETVTVMTSIGQDREALVTRVTDIANAIMVDPTTQGMAVFKAVRGMYLATPKGSAAQKGVSEDWARMTRALWGHFARADLSAKWPNLRSGEGTFSLVTKAEANAEAVTTKAETERKNAEELVAWKQAQAEKELSHLRELGPADMAAHLEAMLGAWSNDLAMCRQVIDALVAGQIERENIALEKELKKLTLPPKKHTSARKPKTETAA